MQIQINTDKNVENSGRLTTYFSDEITSKLGRFDAMVTRIEVHFGDENGDKFGKNDKKCVIEARIAQKPPVAVTDHSDTIEKAFHNAVDKIKKVLDTAHEKMKEHN